MNGYALANAFRTLRESWRFTSTEADLYYELVGIANERSWPTSFQYSNQLLCATIGISEKSLIAARNRLKQAGLLDFVSGHKRAPTAYTLSQKGLPQVSKKGSKSDSVNGSESDSPLYKELKQKENELQIKLSEQRRSADAASAELEKKMAALLAENEALKAQPKEVSPPPVAAAPPRSRTKAPAVEPAHFAAFWELYPRKEKRKSTAETFGRLTEPQQLAAIAGVKDWFARRTDWITPEGKDYRPHPTTWLNESRWTELANPIPQPTHVTRPASPQQPSQRYSTTARGGFGGFAGPGPGGRAAQPIGGTPTGNPPGGSSNTPS